MLNFKDWKVSSQDGTKATLKHANGHEMTIAMKALPKIQREQIMRLAKVQQYDEGSPDTVQSDDSSAVSSPAKPASQQPVINNITVGQPSPSQSQQAPVAPPQNPAAQYAATPLKVQVPTVSQGVPNIDSRTGQPNPTAIEQNSQEAIQDRGKIAAAQAQASVPIEEGYIAGRGQAAATDQDLIGQMHGHVDEFAKYVQAHPINPNAYVENMSAGKKTLSGLGLLLGGMGAGQGNANPALQFLNNQIDRDIAGQQSRVNNQRTVLGAYRDLYGDSTAANNLTKASLLDIYSHKAQLLANQLGTPTAMAAAKELGANSALEKERLIKESAADVQAIPGTAPTSSGVGAKYVPRETQAPEKMGQQGPATAQAGPTEQKGFVDAEGSPIEEKKIIEAGLSPSSSIEDLEEKGIYQKGHSAAEQRKAITDLPIEPILKPMAEATYQRMYYNPQFKERYPEITQQYTQAQQADKQLAQVNGIYGKLIDSSQRGGVFGRIHRSGSHALEGLGTLVGGAIGSVVPGAGTAAGAATGAAAAGGASALTNTDINRYYDSAKTQLFGTLTAALKGTNVNDSTIHELIEKNAPEYGDSPKALKQKHDAIVDFIKSHAVTSLISPLLSKNSK